MQEPTEPKRETKTRPPRRATKELKESLLGDKRFLWSAGWRIGLAVFGLFGVSAIPGLYLAHERIQKQITDTELALSNRVYSSGIQITNLILRTFESSNVTVIVKAVAAERAGYILENQVAPAVKRLTNDIANFSIEIDSLKTQSDLQKSRIQEIRDSLKQSQTIETNLQVVMDKAEQKLRQLDTDTEFITTAIRADHDDRDAFEQLKKWASDDSFRRKSIARRLVQSITTSYFDFHGPYGLVSWGAFDPDNTRNSWRIDDVNMIWQYIPQPQAMDYVDFVSGHTNLTEEQKLIFLRGVYLKDSRNSLGAATTAAKHAAKLLSAKYNPAFIYSSIEERWHEYTKTNHLFDVTKGISTNDIFDVILGTDTNRIVIVKDWGSVRLILFKLKEPPTEDSIEGRYMSFLSGAIFTNSSVGNFKNVVWAKYAFPLSEAKFEFRYVKDESLNLITAAQIFFCKFVEHQTEG